MIPFESLSELCDDKDVIKTDFTVHWTLCFLYLNYAPLTSWINVDSFPRWTSNNMEDNVMNVSVRCSKRKRGEERIERKRMRSKHPPWRDESILVY